MNIKQICNKFRLLNFKINNYCQNYAKCKIYKDPKNFRKDKETIIQIFMEKMIFINNKILLRININSSHKTWINRIFLTIPLIMISRILKFINIYSQNLANIIIMVNHIAMKNFRHPKLRLQRKYSQFRKKVNFYQKHWTIIQNNNNQSVNLN